MRIFIITTLLILLTSCGSTNYYDGTIQGWRGHQKSDLIADWGQPNQMIESANGSQTLVYTTKRPLYAGNMDYQTIVFVAGGKNVGVQVPRNGPKTMMTSCTTIFTVNNQNRITGAQFQGGGCVGKPVK
jgi:hypothetical protein